jgi:aldehyde:ferredoxin oxidoreductase
VTREGIGNLLADGLVPTVEKLGKQTEKYAWHSKKLPLYTTYTANRTIPLKGIALATVVSRGDQMKTMPYVEYGQGWKSLKWRFDEETANEYAKEIRHRIKEITGTEKACEDETYEGKAELVAYIEDGIIIADSLGFCKFHCGTFTAYAPRLRKQIPELLTMGIGKEFTEEHLFNYAKRIKNLERAYDIREGLTRETDSLSKNLMDKPVKEGTFKGSVLDSKKFEQMKNDYYEIRGWDVEKGFPTRKTFENFGLGSVANDLEKAGIEIEDE